MATYIWAISKNKNENQAPRLEVESKDVKRTRFPQNNVTWLKFVKSEAYFNLNNLQYMSAHLKKRSRNRVIFIDISTIPVMYW